MATRRQVVGITTLGVLVGAYGWYFLGEKRLRAERRRAIAEIPRVSFSGRFRELGPARFLDRWSDEVIVRLRRARFPLDNLQSKVADAGFNS